MDTIIHGKEGFQALGTLATDHDDGLLFLGWVGWRIKEGQGLVVRVSFFVLLDDAAGGMGVAAGWKDFEGFAYETENILVQGMVNVELHGRLGSKVGHVHGVTFG